MKKISIAFFSVALLFVTIAAFAERKNLAPYILYYETAPGSGIYQPLTSGFNNLLNLNMSSTGDPVTITGDQQKELFVEDNGGGKVRVYTTSF